MDRTHLSKPVFFTIDYSGLGIDRFVQILKDNGVKTLADSRFNPTSRNPDFRSKALAARLGKEGIRYVHLKEYGIPSEIRQHRKPLDWYLENVKPKIHPSILESYDKPVCFMCMEADINSCHRGIILKTLIQSGCEGTDLYPID